MDVSGAIFALNSGTYVVTRMAPGSYDGATGKFVPGSTSTFSVVASIQPTSGRDLLRLPEGLRTRELVTVFTQDPLQTADAPAGVSPDQIAYQGKTYEVQTVEFWAESGNFYKSIVAKVGQ